MYSSVDRTALKVNQSAIVGLLIIAFILSSAWLVAFVALAMALGTAWPQYGPFRLAYSRLLRPAGLLRPARVDEDPSPHRFALGLGAGCLGLALVLFLAGVPDGAWAVSWFVTILAGINLTAGFCLGCFVHYQLGRLGLLGLARREQGT